MSLPIFTAAVATLEAAQQNINRVKILAETAVNGLLENTMIAADIAVLAEMIAEIADGEHARLSHLQSKLDAQDVLCAPMQPAPRQPEPDWGTHGEDIIITVNNKGNAARGETTTGYYIAQALDALGHRVIISSHLFGLGGKVITSTDVNEFQQPLLIEPRVINVRIGGGVK